MKYFFKRLFTASWIPDEYFELKKKYGKDFEIDGYTHCGEIIRSIRIKLFDDYFDEKITDTFEFIGKIEMKERIKKILKEINSTKNK